MPDNAQVMVFFFLPVVCPPLADLMLIIIIREYRNQWRGNHMNEEFDDYEFEDEFDAWVEEFLKNQPKEIVTVVDFERYKNMIQTVARLTKLFDAAGTQAEVEIEVMVDFCSGVAIIGLDDLVVKDTKQFASLVSRADSYEVYSRTDEKVQIILGFESILRVIKQ